MAQRIVLTPEQKKAINHNSGHLRIIACPGSGKTEVVSRNVATMIQNGVDPKNIVAFTFTEKAADELKTRIRKILDEECPKRADFGDMFIGTIHAFCFFILKEIEPLYRSYDVLDEAKRFAFLSKPQNFYHQVKLDRLKEHHNLSYPKTIDRFLYSADIVMMENIDPSKITDKRFVSCYRAYRKLLDKEKYFDFSTIIHTLVRVLKTDKEKRKLLRERVKHIILDEYQDVNKLQELLLGLLSEGAESVVVVGDDDQSIYHWRGSDVSIIRDFAKRYGKKYKVRDVCLDTNFRSTEAIVHTARSFIEHNVNRLPKSMTHNPKLERKHEDGDIVHKHFQTEDDEFDFIVDKIRELNNTEFIDKKNRHYSLSLDDFAVLVRTNEDAARIINHFEKNGINCIAYSGKSVFDRPEVQLAMDCISYVFDCRGYKTDYPPDIKTLRSTYASVFNQETYPNANPDDFVAKINLIRQKAQKILGKSPKDYLGGLGLQEYYYLILNAMGAENFDFGEVMNYNLAQLSAAISDYETVWTRLRASEIGGFFWFVISYAQSHYAETQHSDTTIINAVKVLTIHKAKGLEFPVVFVPNFVLKQRRRQNFSFVDDRLYSVQKYEGDTEDERRIFYTAITRSEKYLFLTGCKRRHDRKRDILPHPFIQEIDKKYFSTSLSTKKAKSVLPPKEEIVGIYSTSFSELSSYTRCPHDFRMRHIYGFNAGVPVTFGYGTNIHNVLNLIHSRYIREKKLPSDKEIEQTFERMFKLRYATKKISENMKKAGIKLVKNYVKLHSSDFNRILETEKNFEFVIDQALINGQIDLIKRVDENRNLAAVELIDFKTEKQNGAYAVDFEKQLRYYAIACLESLGLKPKKAFVHHLDEGTKSEVDISEKLLSETKHEIKEQVGKILKREFPAKSDKEICQDCDYKLICPYKKFKSVK
ncbi:MAG: ATP-dependent DNA helicase [Nitrososphaera sp.]